MEDVPTAAQGAIPLNRAEGLVLVTNTPKGRGVFAARDISARTILEVSPVLVLDLVENNEHIGKTELYNYTYNWPCKPPLSLKNGSSQSESKPPTTTQAIVLGLGSMFNHSTYQQNVGWERDLENLLVTYTALRDIKAGEELCISYGARLTFLDADEEVWKEEVGENMKEEEWHEDLRIIDLID